MNRLTAIFVLLLAFGAWADVVVPIDEVENNVNIRLSPDASSEIIGRLDQGSSTELVRSIEGWHEVQLESDATGYISAGWTRVIANEESAEEVTEEVVVGVVEPVVEEVTEDAVEAVVEEDPEVAVQQTGESLIELKGTRNFLVKFRDTTEGGNSQIYRHRRFASCHLPWCRET